MRGLVVLLAVVLGGCGGMGELHPDADRGSGTPSGLRFATYQTDGLAASGEARIAGVLREVAGCLVIGGPERRLLAFDQERSRLDGDALVLMPRFSGSKALRMKVGDRVSFAGGYLDPNSPNAQNLTVPDGCSGAVDDPEVAVVGGW